MLLAFVPSKRVPWQTVDTPLYANTMVGVVMEAPVRGWGYVMGWLLPPCRPLVSVHEDNREGPPTRKDVGEGETGKELRNSPEAGE